MQTAPRLQLEEKSSSSSYPQLLVIVDSFAVEGSEGAIAELANSLASSTLQKRVAVCPTELCKSSSGSSFSSRVSSLSLSLSLSPRHPFLTESLSSKEGRSSARAKRSSSTQHNCCQKELNFTSPQLVQIVKELVVHPRNRQSEDWMCTR